jgi:formamidopyrimidine-DNA glycosylase
MHTKAAVWVRCLKTNMPELPEIETFRRNLRDGTTDNPSLLGKRIREARLLWDGSLAEPTPEEFRDRITGQTIHDFGRRAKYLLIQLDQDTLVIHLRMSGDLLVESESDPIATHHRLLLIFADHPSTGSGGGTRLAFNDTRKFGRVWLLDDPTNLFEKLGPEPLDGSLTPEIFHARISRRNRQLKPLLLDQHFIAGLGNIYTDEALHRAGLHPQTLARSLTPAQSTVLLENIRAVLTAGIEANGASIDWVYRGGGFQNQFQVYQRKGKPCYRCGTPIERIVVGQRGTHICPQCQPARGAANEQMGC